MHWNELETREHARLWKGLLKLGPPKPYGPRSELFVQGSPAKQVFLIEQGFAKLEYHTRDARQAAVIPRLPGEWAGLCCACLHGKHFLAATTLTQSLVHEVDVGRLLDVTANLPEAARLLRTTLATNFMRVTDALLALKLQSGRSRFEGLLSDFASMAGNKVSRGRLNIRLPIADAEIAALISVSPEHLSRIKRELKAEGRFQSKGKVISYRPRRPSGP